MPDNLDLYIKQGKAYLQLLKKTNPERNSAKIKEVRRKIDHAKKAKKFA